MNGLISETEDVVQEAIFRVFRGEATGERQWPCHVNFFAFMSGVMQSITSERRKLGFRAHIDRDMEDAPSVVSDAPEPESALNADAVEAYLLSLFDDDEEAQLMLMAWSEDTTKTEILAMTKWDAKKYEAVRKRIRRMLNKHPELREML
ncbi:hypothetical protein [Salinisphaera shabanensis]|uniref:hypothetical protein n=1 Tax=Salinisphaera shabanensis TaxID=180542 RepID=UPI0033410FA6